MRDLDLQTKFDNAVSVARKRIEEVIDTCMRTVESPKASVQEKALAIMVGRENLEIIGVLMNLHRISSDWLLGKYEEKTAFDIWFENWDGSEETAGDMPF